MPTLLPSYLERLGLESRCEALVKAHEASKSSTYVPPPPPPPLTPEEEAQLKAEGKVRLKLARKICQEIISGITFNAGYKCYPEGADDAGKVWVPRKVSPRNFDYLEVEVFDQTLKTSKINFWPVPFFELNTKDTHLILIEPVQVYPVTLLSTYSVVVEALVLARAKTRLAKLSNPLTNTERYREEERLVVEEHAKLLKEAEIYRRNFGTTKWNFLPQ